MSRMPLSRFDSNIPTTGRKSLGPIKGRPSLGRPSLGPARVQQGGGRNVAQARKSMGANAGRPASKAPTARQSSSRQQSMSSRMSMGGRMSMAQGGSSGRRAADPRPISDKGYMSNAIRNLIGYLTRADYPHPVSLKLLTSPTSRDFWQIFTFLYGHIDPSYKFTEKPDVEVPKLMKDLKYPFQINKSSLLAVGSPHAWPVLLAALHWIVELLVYNEIAEENRAEVALGGDDTFTNVENNEKQFFDYLNKAYRAYLGGQDDFGALEEELSSSLKMKIANVEADVANVGAENARLKLEIEKLRAAPNRVSAMEASVSEKKSDLSKFQVFTKQLEDHKRQIEQRIRTDTDDLEQKEEANSLLSAEMKTIAALLETQELNVEDVQRMNKEKTQLEEEINSTMQQKELVLDTVADLEETEAQCTKEAKGAMRMYQEHTTSLQLVPSHAKNARKIHYEIRYNPSFSLSDASDNSNTMLTVIGVDLKRTIKPALVALRDGFARKQAVLQSEIISVQGKLDHNQESLSDKSDDLHTLKQSLAKLQSTIEAEKQAMESDVKEMVSDAETMEAESTKQTRDTHQVLVRAQEDLKRVQEEYELLNEACSLEKEQLSDSMLVAVEQLLNHKQFIQETLAMVENTLTDCSNQIASME
eukprot:TRINITY_DN929_c1_g1_i1.p1 TRINITY_DN929_c1_g1~~TRINITY_DN929_c1_g1_i1.p1  ORF type:complete len:645 (+),score=186.73 TRINITY_DN929_c1_g1_i1:148-2082(+)